jgi:hypothetical protein
VDIPGIYPVVFVIDRQGGSGLVQSGRMTPSIAKNARGSMLVPRVRRRVTLDDQSHIAISLVAEELLEEE